MDLRYRRGAQSWPNVSPIQKVPKVLRWTTRAAELAFPLSLELRFPLHVPVVNFPMHWHFLGRPRRQGRLGILNHQFL